MMQRSVRECIGVTSAKVCSTCGRQLAGPNEIVDRGSYLRVMINDGSSDLSLQMLVALGRDLYDLSMAVKDLTGCKCC